MSDIPLVEIPAELLAQMRERVWFHTASLFAVERSTPVYKGTATCVAVAKKEYLLTAAHVWRELRARSGPAPRSHSDELGRAQLS